MSTLAKKDRAAAEQERKTAELDKMIDDLADIRKQMKVLKEKDSALGPQIVALQWKDRHITEAGNVSTIVRPSKTEVFLDKLKKAVGATLYNKLLSKVFDMNKFEAFVKAGDIPTSVIAECTEDVPGTPYAKITRQ